ncbi:NAD(P)H-dependent amine dehydrogenase family protein [Thermogladius sp. 4427co]|uniref:NAD(P)H-dependent amine dehydrogenase family protein n=1 Tax=Thermogladius sp. 4427co TaxID=3450718 RepID=UPI003F7A8F8D
MNLLKVGIYGFGSIGRLLAKTVIRRGHEVVSVVDIDERILGKDIGELIGSGKTGVVVTRDVKSLAEADVVLHATGSYLNKVYSQIASVIQMGVNVVSTCETLAYPYYRYPVLARKLDEIAEQYGVVVIGTGINPGFLLDTLVATISSTVPVIKKIKAVRSLDAAKRREPFRKKIGVGEDPRVVREKLARGELTGHVGYTESVYLIAYAGDLELTRVIEHQEPLPAEETIESAGVRVEKGLNKGIVGYAAGYVGDREVIRVEFKAYVGAPEYDEIVVEGEDYTISWRSSGTPGDTGTASIVVSVAEKVPYLPPGLRLMTELLPFKISFG